MKTISDVLKFVRQYHRKLDSWTDVQIINSIIHAINRNTFVYTLNNKGELSGVVAGHPVEDENNLIDIYFICAPNNLHSFLHYFRQQFGKTVKLRWKSRRNQKIFVFN